MKKITCTDCGVELSVGHYKSFMTTTSDLSQDHGLCRGCHDLRAAEATCQPTGRLRYNQRRRSARLSGLCR